MHPNGVFYVTKDGEFGISETAKFNCSNIEYATQSGPMLIVNGEYTEVVKFSMKTKLLRSGVGVKKNGDLVFAISYNDVSFYDLAKFFYIEDCINALYLDGNISRMYLPEKNYFDYDGYFGPIITVFKKTNNNGRLCKS